MAFAQQSKISEELPRKIEEQAGRIPNLGFLGLAVGSMALSASLEFLFKKRDLGQFVGLWAPTILILGIYNKIAKLDLDRV